MKIQQSVGRPLAEPASLAPRVAISPFLDEQFPSLDQLLTAHDVARLVRRPRWYFCGLALLGRFPAKRRFRGRWAGWMRSDVSQWMQKNLLVPGTDPAKTNRAQVIARQRHLPLGPTEWCPSIRRRRRRRWPPKNRAQVSMQVRAAETPSSRAAREDRQ
jgi:predicted DNA-binding transcriptional regulator AlpA